MTIRCLVVDDEPLGRRLLEEYISEVPDLTCLGSVHSALQAQSYLDQGEVDLIFLDINMPKLSGIEWIKSVKHDVLVIFTTAYSEYAVEAFDVAAVDFLVKPISMARFMLAVNRVRKHLKSESSSPPSGFITFKEGKRLYKLNVDSIQFLKSFGDYIRIFTAEKTYITKERMHHMVGQIGGNFMQVHRSYVVNLQMIDYLEGNHLNIGTSQIPISANFRKALLVRLQQDGKT